MDGRIGITRGDVLKCAAIAAPGSCSAGAPAPRPRRARARAARGRGHERARLPDRPAAGDPALPAGLGRAQPARPDPAAAARPDVRERVHQRVHVLAGALDADVRLLPRPARRQVHARDRHARAAVPAGRARDELQEPRHGGGGRRLHAGLQGEVPLQQAGERLDLGPRGRQPVRLHALGSAGRGRQPVHARGGWRQLRQRRPLHERPGHARGGHRGRGPVPRARRPPRASRSSWSSRWSTRTTCSSTRRRTRARGYDDSWLQGEIEPPATARRGPLDQADRAEGVPAAVQRRRGRSRRGR